MLADKTPYENDGTINGATFTTDRMGQPNKAMSFDGANNYVEVVGSNISTSPLAITGAITLSTWIKFNRNDVIEYIIGRGKGLSSPGNYGYFLSKSGVSNQICFDNYSLLGVRDSLISNTAITDFNWHLIIITWNGTTDTNGKKMYIDGILDKQKTSAFSAIGQPDYTFKIGKQGSSFFKGSIDDVRIYNAALSSSQIKQEYIAGLNSLLANNNISKEEYLSRIENLSLND